LARLATPAGREQREKRVLEIHVGFPRFHTGCYWVEHLPSSLQGRIKQTISPVHLCSLLLLPTICSFAADTTSAFGVGVGKGASDEKDKQVDSIDENELILVAACLCCHDAFYCQFPNCIGCSSKCECICCIESFCCKMGTAPILCNPADDRMCFQLGCACCGCGCLSPTTCCKSQGQVCCLTGGGAFPCDAEFPMMCALCGLACYPGVGCCKKIGELKGGVGDGEKA